MARFGTLWRVNVRTGAVIAACVTGAGGYFGVLGFFILLLISTYNEVLSIQLALLSAKCVLELAVSIMLLYGASAEKRGLVLPWIYCTILSLVVGTGLHIGVVATLMPSGLASVLLLIFLIYALCQLLCLPFVRAFYKELETRSGDAEATEDYYHNQSTDVGK